MLLLLQLRAKAVFWDTVVLENKHPCVRQASHPLTSLKSLFSMAPEDVHLHQEWLKSMSKDQRKRGPTVCQFLHTEKAFIPWSLPQSSQSVSVMIPSSYKVLYHSS